jgi:hypothetical protein
VKLFGVTIEIHAGALTPVSYRERASMARNLKMKSMSFEFLELF